MLERLFEWIYAAVAGSAAVALSASFVWGVLSVAVSPCHLSSIPLIVGFISGQGQMTRARAFAISSLFALGVLVTIAILGVITGLMGRMWGDVGNWANFVVAALLVLVGLTMLDVIPMPFSGASGGMKMTRRGGLAAFLLGLVFGIALGPCTFGFMIPVLEASRRAAADNLAYAISLVGLYGVGHCAIIAAAGTSAESVQRYLNWNERSRGAVIVRRACGVLVIAAAVYLVYRAL